MEAVVGWIVVVFQNLHPESDLLRARMRLQEVRIGEIEERRMMVTCEAWKWLKKVIKEKFKILGARSAEYHLGKKLSPNLECTKFRNREQKNPNREPLGQLR
jgi:hypothetical protein